MGEKHGPVGTSVAAQIERRRSGSSRYRRSRERLQPFEEIARVVIMRRAHLGISQQEVAERMGTTASVISRIESGQHRIGTETLRRLAEALDGRALVGFDFGTAHRPERQFVSL